MKTCSAIMHGNMAIVFLQIFVIPMNFFPVTACDAFLMPSRFQNHVAGTTYFIRYGTVPIVRETELD